MKVLQLISSGGYYGAESMLLNLISADQVAISQNLLGVFYNRHRPNTELYDRALRRGVEAKMIPCQGKIDWRGVREIRHLVRQQDIDIIHTHGYKADLYAGLAARREGKPVVATCHNWLVGGTMLSVYNFLDRIALRHFDAVTAVSEVIAEKLLSFGVPWERITVIPNGIDVEAFKVCRTAPLLRPRGEEEQTIGIIARLDLQKGFQCLLRAVATLRHSFPRLRLLIVGDGSDRSRIEQMVSQQQLNNMVTLAGQQQDMPAVWASFDIFVLPSLNEGLPMTLLEAMAASKPIIATRVGAIPTVITHGETGLLIDPGDEAALASALTQLLANPDQCRRLGRSACAHVERNYTAAAMIQKYQDLYRKVLMGRGAQDASKTTKIAADDGSAEQHVLSLSRSGKTEEPNKTFVH